MSHSERFSIPSAPKHTHTHTIHTSRNCSLPLDCPGGPVWHLWPAPFNRLALRFSDVLFSRTLVVLYVFFFPPRTPHALCSWIFLALFWLGFIDFICTALATHTRESREKPVMATASIYPLIGMAPKDLWESQLLRSSIYLHFVALEFVAGQDVVPDVTSSLLQAVLSSGSDKRPRTPAPHRPPPPPYICGTQVRVPAHAPCAPPRALHPIQVPKVENRTNSSRAEQKLLHTSPLEFGAGRRVQKRWIERKTRV